MKYLIFLTLIGVTFACGSQQNRYGIQRPERVTYKLFIEEDGYIGQTPAMLYVDIIPNDQGGFYRVQQLEGPGVLATDSVKVNRHGRPLMQVYSHGRNKVRRIMREGSILQQENQDTFSIPNSYPTFFTITQMDLVLKGLDTTSYDESIPFLLVGSTNFDFITPQEIGPDSTYAHWLTREKIPTVHRFASVAGSIYEGWYAADEILPIKWKVTHSGSVYVYLRYVVEEESEE